MTTGRQTGARPQSNSAQSYYSRGTDAAAFYSTTATAYDSYDEFAASFAPAYEPQDEPQHVPKRAPSGPRPSTEPLKRGSTPGLSEHERQNRAKKHKFMTAWMYAHAIVLAIAVLIGGVVIVAQYERISSLNFKAKGLAKEIDIYEDQITSLEVKLACTLDLNALNEKALEKGMNYPLDEQIVELP